MKGVKDWGGGELSEKIEYYYIVMWSLIVITTSLYVVYDLVKESLREEKGREEFPMRPVDTVILWGCVVFGGMMIVPRIARIARPPAEYLLDCSIRCYRKCKSTVGTLLGDVDLGVDLDADVDLEAEQQLDNTMSCTIL